MRRPTGFEILEYIEQPENSRIASFLRSVQDYYDYYGIEHLFILFDLFELYQKWIEYLDKETLETQTCKFLLNDMESRGYNPIDKYIILDILILYFKQIHFERLNDDLRDFVWESIKKEEISLSRSIPDLSLKQMTSIVEGFKDKPHQIKLDILYIYLLHIGRGIESRPNNRNYLVQFITYTINNLIEKHGGSHIKGQAELLLQKINNPVPKGVTNQSKLQLIVDPSSDDAGTASIPNIEISTHNFSENEKLFIKDVAQILKCHESQVRRLMLRKVNPLKPYRDSPKGKMYFFYSEIVDWMRSHKQMSPLDEAGEVFRRKPKGSIKKRRPRLG